MAAPTERQAIKTLRDASDAFAAAQAREAEAVVDRIVDALVKLLDGHFALSQVSTCIEPLRLYPTTAELPIIKHATELWMSAHGGEKTVGSNHMFFRCGALDVQIRTVTPVRTERDASTMWVPGEEAPL